VLAELNAQRIQVEFVNSMRGNKDPDKLRARMASAKTSSHIWEQLGVQVRKRKAWYSVLSWNGKGSG
jgi:hypothetical protein